MRKTLVTYISQTGNTKKVAEAIFDSLGGEKDIIAIGDSPDAAQYSLLFVGFPVHSHSIPFRAEAFLKTIPAGKRIALFSTHGSLTGSRLSREALEYAVTLASKAKVLGTFSCRGKVSAKALEVLSKSPEHAAWSDMAASARNHPDKHDLEDAKTFGHWIMTLYAQP
jgi:flavodoxin I